MRSARWLARNSAQSVRNTNAEAKLRADCDAFGVDYAPPPPDSESDEARRARRDEMRLLIRIAKRLDPTSARAAFTETKHTEATLQPDCLACGVGYSPPPLNMREPDEARRTR